MLDGDRRAARKRARGLAPVDLVLRGRRLVNVRAG